MYRLSLWGDFSLERRNWTTGEKETVVGQGRTHKFYILLVVGARGMVVKVGQRKRLLMVRLRNERLLGRVSPIRSLSIREVEAGVCNCFFF